jgi:hypothetical protein
LAVGRSPSETNKLYNKIKIKLATSELIAGREGAEAQRWFAERVEHASEKDPVQVEKASARI